VRRTAVDPGHRPGALGGERETSGVEKGPVRKGRRRHASAFEATVALDAAREESLRRPPIRRPALRGRGSVYASFTAPDVDMDESSRSAVADRDHADAR
jgi:hypothetical protein